MEGIDKILETNWHLQAYFEHRKREYNTKTPEVHATNDPNTYKHLYQTLYYNNLIDILNNLNKFSNILYKICNVFESRDFEIVT